MRICLVTHGFPPLERTGVENYTAALAAEFARIGHSVEVFAPRIARDLPNLSMRREERDGYGITWLSTNTSPHNQEEMLDVPGVAERFGDFLDRERPQLIHFQHLIKLGMGLVAQAEERRIPTVYTAHDYYAVCHRFTLVRPDLERCGTVGDPALCARCDLALSFLNRQDGLGDYQLGALRGQLDAEAQAGLDGILAGDPESAGFSVEELAGFTQRRTSLDDRRRETYQRFDLVLSPTRFLGDRLIEGGVDPDRIEILTYGAEVDRLIEVPDVRRRPGEKLRFGYIGGLSKHKGVHVLVDAFEQMETKPDISIWGGSSDAVYADALRERAARAGIRWRGPFRRTELGDCLAEIDVVVVPSIWVENYPFVIREAFAARRPVVATDVGAIPESVRHEVDGLLFAPGDAQALAGAMQRLEEEDGLLEKLVEGIEPVKGIEEQAQELTSIYERILHEIRERERRSLPPSLREPGRRFEELNDLPLRELFRLVLSGLEKVKGTLSDTGDLSDGSLSAEALATGSKAQVLLRDLKREKAWLHGSLISQAKTEEALRDRLEWREDELENRRVEVEWLRGVLEGKEQECKWQADEIAHLKKEVEWLRDSLVAYEYDLTWYQEKRRILEEQLDGVGQEKEELRARLEREREKLRTGLQALTDLADRTSQIQDYAFGHHVGPMLELLREAPEAATLEELSSVVLAGNRQVFQLLEELAKRRYEMGVATHLAERALVRLLVAPTGLGKLVRRWRRDSEAQANANEPNRNGDKEG